MGEGALAKVTNLSEASIFTMLKAVSLLPGVVPDPEKVVRKVNTLTGDTLGLQAPADFLDGRVSLEALDRAAKDYTQEAWLASLSGGAAAGAAGLVGVAANVSVLVATTVGMVHRHALTYGFTDIADDADNRLPLLLAMAAALGADAAITLVRPGLANILGNAVIRAAALKAAEKQVAQQIATTLVSNTTATLLPRAVPIMGVLTGAGLNAWFLHKAGGRSVGYWRERHQLRRPQAA